MTTKRDDFLSADKAYMSRLIYSKDAVENGRLKSKRL